MPDITKKKQTTTGTGSARKKALEETKKRLEAKKSIAEAFEADGYTPDKPNTYVRDTKVGTTPIIGAGQYADSTGKRNQFSFSEQQRRANEQTARTNYMTAAQQKASAVADKTVPSMAFQMLRQMLSKPTTFAQSGSARKDINQWYGDNTRTNNGFQSFSKPDTLYKARQTPLIAPEVLTENERKAREGYLSPTAKTDAFGNLIDKRTDINSLRESVSAPIQTREEDQKQNKAADYMDEKALAAQQKAAIKKAQAGRSPEEQIVRFLGGTGRAAQNSIYNYGGNILNSIDALNHKTDQMYGMSGTKIERDKLDKAFKNISERAQQDIDSGNISVQWAQTVDTAVRMGIDATITAATAGLFSGATAATSGNRIANAVLDAVQNPAFYTSYVQEFGSDYADYVNNGVDEDKAVLIAGTIALLNSYVEVQGGTEKSINSVVDRITQKIPKSAPFGTFKEIFTNSLEEALEEIIQAPIGNLGTKLAYNPDQVVFDPVEQLSNGWSAFISSLMLGGATAGIEYGVNRNWKNQDISSQYAYIGQQVKKDNGTLSDLLSQAETSNNVNARFQSYTIQQALANGESPSDYKVGQLAATMAENEQIEAERQKIVGERQAKQEQKRQKKNQSQQTEEAPVQQETDRVISAPLDEEVMPETGTETEPSTRIETVPQTARADENTASVQAIQEPETQAAAEESASVTHSAATSVATPEQRQAAQNQPLEISAREMNSFGENGQRALRAGLTRAAQNGESQTAYKNAFTAYYKWGTWGKDISQIDSAFSGSISQSAAYAAYMSGVNDNAAVVTRNTANQRKATGTGGLVQGTHNSKVDANTRNYLDAVGRAFRVSIAIDDEGSGYNGMLDKDGVVHIAADTTRPAAGVLNHELTHVLRSRSESDYQTYKNVVAAFINKESEGAFEQRVEELIDLYAENGQSLTRDDAEEEIVANASERFLTDKESVDLMVKQNRGVAKKILDGIRSIINKLKGVIRDKSIHNKEARILSRDLETFQRAERVWVSALSGSTGEMNEEVSVNEKTASTKEAGTVKWQLTEDKSSVVERMLRFIQRTLNGDFNGKKWSFLIGKVSEKAAQSIENVTGIDVSGYEHRISPDAVIHIEKRHGVNGEHDNSMAKSADIAQIPYILNNFSNIEIVKDRGGNVALSRKYRDKNNQNAPMIRMELPIKNNNFYVVEAVPDTKAHALWVVSAYAEQIKEEGNEQELEWRKNSQQLTSETSAASLQPSSTFRIVKKQDFVNSQNAQTKEKFSLKETDKESRKNINPNGGNPYYNDRSYRGYSKSGALSAYGHAMFADDPDSISGYSGRDDARDRGFYTVMHSDLESIDNLKAAIAEAWDEDAENGLTPSGYEDVTGEKIAEQFDPEDIVDSAGAWDNGELISWAFDRGLFDDVSGVKTYDGAVAWDESIIHRANEDSDEGVIGEIKDEKLQLREDNPYDWLDDGDEDYSDEDIAPTPGDEDAPPETVIKENLGGDWLDRQVDRTISSNENVESTIAAIRAEGRAFKDVKPGTVDQVVKAAAKQYGATDTTQLNTAVHGALDYLARHGEEGTGSAIASVYQAVKETLSKAESVDRTMYDETKGMRDYLRTTRIYVPDSVKSDITDYNDFRKSLFGKVRIVNDPTAMHIDQAYAELSAQYPSLLSSEIINPSAQLQEIADTLDAAQPVIVASYGEDGQTSFIGNINEASIDMTTDILHSLVQTAITQTQDAKLRQQLIKQREKFAEQKKALRQELKNKYKTELISQQTEAKAQAALAQTNFGIEMAQKQKELKNKYKTELISQQVKAKAQAALTAQNTAKRIAAIREANRLSKKKAADKRAIAKRRQSVEKITTRLYRKLSKPTDTQHIPQGFRVSVANFLSSLDFEGRDKAGNVKDTKVNAAWQELARECRRIANAEANDTDSTYLTIDPDLADRLDELSKTPVRDMNKEQIEELYKAARAIEKAVTDADQVRVNGQMRQATDVARGIISDMVARAKEDRKIFRPTAGAKEFLQWDMMDPVRFADRMGDSFKEVYQNLRDGHDSKIEMWQEAKDYIDSAIAESGLVGEKASEGRIQKALRNLEDSKVKITAGGKGITVSKAQLMSLYNIDRREQGRSHLYGGGIRLPSEDGTIIRTEHNTEYHITEEEVKAAIGNLSKEEIAFANKLQKFLATDAARWGNKASMEMYGYKKFNEDLYWTLRADHNFTRSEVGQPGETKRSASILSSGFTKQLVEKASNPVYLDSALDVFASHVTEMSSYAAYAVPLNTMNKVLNWQTRHDGNWRSVRKSLTMAYGDRATGYLNNLLAEINGEKIGAQSLNMIQKVTGHAKAAAIGGNLRVVVQQPTSYMRAMDVIPTKYLMMGVFKNSKLTGKSEIEEMYRVVPEARWKNWGYGGDGFKGSNFKELIQGKNLLGKVEDFGSGAAGFADDITWHSMYRACAYWSEGEGHIRGTEDWRQDVRKKFNQVIDQTQVYDSPFKNGQIFKTGGSFGDIFTAFMKEPVTNYNVVMGHIGEINRLNTELRAAKGDKAAVKSIKAMRRKAVGGLVRGSLGVILAGVAAGLVTAPIDIARDKDDEDWLTKLRNALLGESVKDAWSSEDTTGLSKAAAVYGAVVDGSLLDNVNPVGWIPILSSIQDMIDGYDVEVMGVGAIADVGQAATDLTNSINGKPMRNTTRYYTYNLIKKLSVISGIPISNLARAGESLLNAGLMAYEEANGTSASELKFLAEQQYYSPKSSSGQKAFLKTMYEAELEGNNDLAIRIGNFLIQNGDMTYDDVQNQIASLVKADEKFSGLVEDYANAYNSNNYTKLIEIGKKANQLGVSADHIQRAAKSLISGELGDYADTYAAMAVSGTTDGLDDLLDAAEAAGLNRFDVIDSGSKKAEKLQAEFNKDSLMEDAEYKTAYLYSSLAKAKLRGDSTMAGKITDTLTDMGKDEDKISNGTASALKNLAAQQQGYKTYKELTDAGKELDVSSDEYKLLLSEFGDSQYKASSVAEAIISGDTARAEKQIEELKKSEWKDKSAGEVSKTVKSAIMSAMRKEMGYESAEEFSEAGAVYDPNSAGVKYVKKLDPDYQFYKYADIAAAYLEGNTAAAQKMANAIVGTHTDSGYERTEDDVWKGVVNNLQDKFNACYNLGKGNESEWRLYVKAMQSLGQNWDKTLSRYRKTSQYKKDSGQS